MKTKFIAGLILSFICVGAAFAQTTEFTYQGRLTDGGMAPTGSYDFEFRLYDASNNLLGTLARNGVAVANGSFTVALDYGSTPNQFTGAARLLEIAVRPAGGGSFTTLSPRQPVSSSPYAIRSREAGTADTATNATQLGGVDAARFVQSDINGNVSIGGNLTVGGTLTQPIVNATTEYQIAGERVFRLGPFGTTLVGLNAGVNTTSGGNSFFGADSGMATTNGVDNSYFGRSAGMSGTSNGNNSFFGVDAGRNNTASNNSFFGRSAGFDNTTGVSNAFFGFDAGRFNTIGGANSFFGSFAGRANVGGINNSFFGTFAGASNTASDNSFFGRSTGSSTTTGENNSFFGSFAGFSNTEGSANSFFGRDAGRSNTTGIQNSFFGWQAGRETTSAFSNAFFGTAAGRDNRTGAGNSIFGALAGTGNIIGNNNSYFGHLAGQTNTDGANNSVFGSSAGRFNTAGNNSFFGASAGNANTTGAGNSFFGLNAGNANTMGSNNTVIGNNGDVGTDNLNFATAIGAGSVVNASNTVVLGRSGDTVQIPGNLNLTGSFTGSFTVPAANITGVLGVANGGTNLSLPGASGNFLRSNGTTWASSPIGAADIPSGQVVKKLNNLSDNVTLAAGTNITITPSGNTLTIASTGGGGGGGILNQTTLQTGANFNIDGTGKANIFNAVTQFELNGERILKADLSDGDGGGENLFVGLEAGQSNKGGRNSFFGYGAGQDNTSGGTNSFFGSFAGGNNSTGGSNSFFGQGAGRSNNSGSSNAFFGRDTGSVNNEGDFNSYFGQQAGANSGGSRNTFIGYQAGISFNEGSSNTLLGTNTALAFASENIFFATAIGANARVTTNDTIVLGKVAGMYEGDMRSADTVRIPGNLVVSGTINGSFAPPAEELMKQKILIDKLQKELDQLRKTVEVLRRVVCQQSPQTEVCRQ